jgi:hypothetical protein
MKVQLAFLAGLLACAFTARAADIWTLERSLDYALPQPDARIAQQRIVAAQAGLEQANSASGRGCKPIQLHPHDNPMLVSAASSINGLTALRSTSTTFPCG